MNKEEYTSFVRSAKAIAMIGGKSANHVPYTLISDLATDNASFRFAAKFASESTFSSYASIYSHASKSTAAGAGAYALTYSRPTTASTIAIRTTATTRRVFKELI